LIPHIPHILTRLRTLSTLHSSAAEFQNTIEDLEQEQKKMRSTLLQLQEAVHTIETSLDDNREVVKNNVRGLEERVSGLLSRLEELGRQQKD
jgi:nuclear migration protein JNM1